ncbi:MAG: hypothetical protein H0V81_11055, partial [Solirubrobacterales bacterium]|nr:hypothetical protein [Solirubrobacterales bacterium]
MSTASCVFALHGSTVQAQPDLSRRATALGRFLGLDGVAIRHLPALRLTIGRLGPGPPLDGASLIWGAPWGAISPSNDVVLAAGDAALRGQVGMGCTISWSEHRARLVTAPSGPVALYTAARGECQAWATHATAAALIAGHDVEIDWSLLPEHLAYDFVGGGLSFVRHARAVEPATCVDVTPDRATSRSVWPARDRWALVSEADAQRHAADALVASLEARVARDPQPTVMLTGGADSRVLAVALDAAARPFSAMHWGEDGWPDAQGARRIAGALGVPLTTSLSVRVDSEMIEEFGAQARWTDGGALMAPGRRVWPEGAGPILLGTAGEVGRAFYYRSVSRGREPRDRSEVAAHLQPRLRLPGAGPDAVARATSRSAGWVDDAAHSEHEGWRLLDIVYAEQRVAHWGRIQIPRLEAALIAGFAPVEVMRGLVSLPLESRIDDGFARRFVEIRRPDLALPAPSVPTVPSTGLRALAGRMRTRLRPVPPVGPDVLLRALWAERPVTRSWVTDYVLATPIAADVMGPRWVEVTRAAFLRGDPRAIA